MTTLNVIPTEAVEALKEGKHVKIKDEYAGGEIVLAFEESVSEDAYVCDWEEEHGWDSLKIEEGE